MARNITCCGSSGLAVRRLSGRPSMLGCQNAVEILSNLVGQLPILGDLRPLSANFRATFAPILLQAGSEIVGGVAGFRPGLDASERSRLQLRRFCTPYPFLAECYISDLLFRRGTCRGEIVVPFRDISRRDWTDRAPLWMHACSRLFFGPIAVLRCIEGVVLFQEYMAERLCRLGILCIFGGNVRFGRRCEVSKTDCAVLPSVQAACGGEMGVYKSEIEVFFF